MSPSDTTIISPRRGRAISAYLLASLLGAVGQLCFKTVASGGFSSVGDLAGNGYLWMAIGTYVAIMGLFVYGLKCWDDMSTLYPIYGSTFVFALVLSSFWLGERPEGTAVAGTVFIVVGIVLLTRNKRAS